MSYNHFDYVPSTVDRRRSTFKFDKAIAKGALLGFLYPVCKPVAMMPGSSISLDLAAEIRSNALIRPMMDEMYCDFFSFFVPNRIVWEHWKQFIGAVDDVLFNNLTQYNIPSFTFGKSDISRFCKNNSLDGSNFQWNQWIGCHFELPFPGVFYDPNDNDADVANLKSNCPIISALPFRGYTFIWNEFFRPEQLVAPLNISKSDDGWAGDNMDHNTYSVLPTSFNLLSLSFPTPVFLSYVNPLYGISGGCVLPVYRVHRDLYTSCLPAPSLETLNLLAGLSAPVGIVGIQSTTGNNFVTQANLTDTFQQASSGETNNTKGVVADLNQALLTVNNYRETIMLQNYYDVLNRAGSRYDEIIRNIFGVTTSNAVTDIPELITHKRFTIYRNQVVSTAETLDSSNNTVNPVGSQAAYIDTVVRDNFFTRSTTEHGYIHMMFAIRPARIRSDNGIEPDWMKLDKFSLYYPQFDGMGDVARYKIEKYYDYGLTFAGQKSSILGYQEYGADWKWQRNSNVGWFDEHTPNTITGYTLVENLRTAPVLVDTSSTKLGYVSCFMECEAFARCLAVSNPLLAPQFILDIRLNGTITHPMPVYNIPGQGALL